jgi:hypothetical protein
MQCKAKDAYSSGNKKLGHIVHTTPDSFLLQRGVLLGKARHLPTRLLAHSDADRAHLVATRAEVEALARRDPPPAGDAWYGAIGESAAPPVAPAVGE